MNNNYYFLFIFIIFSSIGIYIKFYSIIKFVNKKYIKSVLNESNYFEKFNRVDYQIRKCVSKYNCMSNYLKNVESFTIKEKLILIYLVIKINNSTSKYSKLKNIKWKFAKYNSNIENGFPHTLLDTIFLTEDFFIDNKNQLSTLLHEKMHLYQKLYIEKTDRFYKNLGFIIKKCDCNKLHRTNPDIIDKEHYIYENKEVIVNYNNDARTLSDISYNKDSISNNLQELKSQFNLNIEHPNEIFATLITEFILYNKEINLVNFKEELKKYLE